MPNTGSMLIRSAVPPMRKRGSCLPTHSGGHQPRRVSNAKTLPLIKPLRVIRISGLILSAAGAFKCVTGGGVILILNTTTGHR